MSYHSKTLRLTEIFLSDLAGDRFQKEEYIPSAERLASLYSASRNTIRRMLNNLVKENVLERCGNQRLVYRQRLFTAAEEELASAPRPTIAFVYSGSSDNNIVMQTHGIEKYAEKHHLNLRIFADFHGFSSMLDLLNHTPLSGIDGIIVVSHPIPAYAEAVNRLVDAGVPVVQIGANKECRASTIGGDDFSGMYAAVSTLIHKYDRPAYFIGPPANADERFRAFRQAMTDAGYLKGLEERILVLGQKLDAPEHWEMKEKMLLPAKMLRPFLSRQKLPASIVCGNDYIAYGVYEAAAELELKIGTDLAIVGFSDLPFACRMTPPLSSVRVDVHMMGYQAAWLLDCLIQKKLPAPQYMLMPAKLIERESY